MYTLFYLLSAAQFTIVNIINNKYSWKFTGPKTHLISYYIIHVFKFIYRYLSDVLTYLFSNLKFIINSFFVGKVLHNTLYYFVLHSALKNFRILRIIQCPDVLGSCRHQRNLIFTYYHSTMSFFIK